MSGPPLPPGLYEQILTQALEEALAGLPDELADRRSITDLEAPDRFAMHLATAVRRALGAQREEGRAQVSAQIVRSLLHHLTTLAEDYDDAPEAPTPGAQILHSVARRNPDGTSRPLPSPITPLLDTTVLTNSRQDQNMWAHLKSEIGSACGVDAIVAFIRVAGVNPLIPALTAQIEDGHRLRFLTTTFTGFTQVEALTRLQDLGAEVRVSYDTQSTRLHAKAWIFHRPGHSSTAFVGSSNATAHALQSGMEWNVRLAQRRNPDAVEKMRLAFDSYWESDEFRPFDAEEFRAALPTNAPDDTSWFVPLDIKPHPFQARLLEQIAVARRHGHTRNLLVAATGTGKTVMAALDYRDMARSLDRARLLFVAHREEILEQSIRTFRLTLGDPTFGEKWVGGSRAQQFTHVFASIQSLNAAGVDNLDPEHFDVVIVDEFHHAAADSYQRLLERVSPQQLLGLTATPERADGLSVLDYFDGRIAAELRLWDAIAEERLAPFHYYGIHDGLSLQDVPWRRGRGYDVEALANVYTSDDAWARLVVRKTVEHVGSPADMRALGFCVNVSHARFMADRFNAAGIPAVAVWGDSPRDDRRKALRDLRDGGVRVVFSVDVFNEGVDVPDVDTLLMLRPTESATLFLQQLGRGLRKTEDKAVCTVLDFVGHHRREFRFEPKMAAMLGGGTRKTVTRNVEHGFPNLPPGVSINLDPIAQKVILESIRNALPRTRTAMVAELKNLVAAGHEPTLATFLDETGLDLTDVYTGSSSWSDLLEAAGLPTAARGEHETPLRRAIGRLLHVDDDQRLSAYNSQLPAGPPALTTDRETRLWRMLSAQMFSQVGAEFSLDEALRTLWSHGQVRRELSELFDVLAGRVDHLHTPLGGDNPLQVHARYSRNEILAAHGAGDPRRATAPAWREGVKWIESDKTDAFVVTLDKSGGNFSPTTAYRDYAISRSLFHWESQAMTGEDSPTGRRYQEHVRRGSSIHLFARMTTDDRAFWFLGPATYVKHEGSRPMAITWRLLYDLPADLYTEFAAVEVA
jgi:superfamily II DNA or RNA helicase